MRSLALALIALAACGGGDGGDDDGDQPDAHGHPIDARSPADAGPDGAPPDAPDGPPAVVAVTCPAEGEIATTVGTSNFAYTYSDGAMISVGDVVHFVLEDVHNARSDTGLFTVGFGGDTCLRFDQTGTFPFHCTAHASVTGSITVQ